MTSRLRSDLFLTLSVLYNVLNLVNQHSLSLLLLLFRCVGICRQRWTWSMTDCVSTPGHLRHRVMTLVETSAAAEVESSTVTSALGRPTCRALTHGQRRAWRDSTTLAIRATWTVSYKLSTCVTGRQPPTHTRPHNTDFSVIDSRPPPRIYPVIY